MALDIALQSIAQLSKLSPGVLGKRAYLLQVVVQETRLSSFGTLKLAS